MALRRAFCLHNRTWVQLTPSGTAPAARQGHAVYAYQSQVSLLGAPHLCSVGWWSAPSPLSALSLDCLGCAPAGGHRRWRDVEQRFSDVGDRQHHPHARHEPGVQLPGVRQVPAHRFGFRQKAGPHQGLLRVAGWLDARCTCPVALHAWPQWRTLSGGSGTLLNSSTQTPAATSIATNALTNQFLVQLPTVRLVLHLLCPL